MTKMGDIVRMTARRGRPSSYGLSRCDEIVVIMREGYTMTAAAGLMGVARVTLYRWAEAYPDFCYALGLAKSLYSLKWERELLTATDVTRLRVCIAALRNTDEFRGGRSEAASNLISAA